MYGIEEVQCSFLNHPRKTTLVAQVAYQRADTRLEIFTIDDNHNLGLLFSQYLHIYMYIFIYLNGVYVANLAEIKWLYFYKAT